MPSDTDAGPLDAAASNSSTAQRVVVERPPPGLARGRYEWPSWAIASVGSVVVILGAAFIIWRFWRLRRRP